MDAGLAFLCRRACWSVRAFYKQHRGRYRSRVQSTFTTGDMSDKNTWEKFYSDRPSGENFDWFLNFEDVKDYLDSLSLCGQSIPRVLDIGCGTSEFGKKLLEHFHGKCRIDGIDFSLEAIKEMKKQAECKKYFTAVDGSTGLFYQVADARNIPFCNGTFSLALDKGTGDAMLRSEDGEISFTKLVSEALRVLQEDGEFVQFSDEPPEVRLLLLEKVGLTYFKEKNAELRVRSQEIGVRFGIEHFLYVIKVTHKEKLT